MNNLDGTETNLQQDAASQLHKRYKVILIALFALLFCAAALVQLLVAPVDAAPASQDPTSPLEQPTDLPPAEPTPVLPPPTPTFAPLPTLVPLTERAVRNAAIIVPSISPSGTVQLVDGAFVNPTTGASIRIASVPIALGDLTGDGTADAAVIVDVVLPDDLYSTDLVIVENQNGQPVATSAVRLGSPAQVQRMYIDRGAIWIDMLTAGPLDDPCCPTIPQQRIFVPSGGGLLDLPAIATGKLFPYRVGNKYGYVNALGEFIVAPQYAFAGSFSEGLALVSFDAGRFGFINMLGQVVIPMRYSFATSFRDGVAVAGVPAVTTDQVDSVVYLDRKGNNILGETTFPSGLPFSEGFAAVRTADGRFGYINRRGAQAFPTTFDFAQEFSEGLAPVLVGDKVGYVDRTGNIAVEPAFDAGDDFSEGLAAVAQAGKVGYIDQRGAFVIQPAYDFAGPFSGGLAAVQLNDAEFYVDISGRAVITQPVMTNLRPFQEGLAAVRVDGKVGYIDLAGAMIIRPQYTEGTDFQDGLAIVETESTWSVITHDGTVLVQLAKSIAPQIADTSAPTTTQETVSSSVTTTTAAVETEVIRFRPEIPDEIRSGACMTSSNIVSAANAFRCSADNVVYDPCFLAADNTTVVCSVDPALGGTGFVLQLTQPLPAVTLEGRTFPSAWLFQLANGAICRYSEGQSINVAGQRVQYVCSDLTQLLGDIDTTVSPWTINIVTTTDDGAGNYSVESLTPTTVVRVWVPAPPPAAPTPTPEPLPTETLPPGVTPTEAPTPTPATLSTETPTP